MSRREDKTKSILLHYRCEVRRFSYPKCSNSYQKKRDEIITFAETIKTILNEDEARQKIEADIADILKTLDSKAEANEEILKCFELLDEVDREVSTLETSKKTPETKIATLDKCHTRVISIESADEEVLYEKQQFLHRIESLRGGLEQEPMTDQGGEIGSSDVEVITAMLKTIASKMGIDPESLSAISNETIVQEVSQMKHNVNSKKEKVLRQLKQKAEEYEDLMQCSSNLDDIEEDLKTKTRSNRKSARQLISCKE